MARILDPSLDGWRERPRAAPGMSAAVVGEAVTFAGIADRPGLIAAVAADNAAWTLPLTAGQGADAVAAAFAALIAADRPASAAGPVLTLPNALGLAARVVAGGTEAREVRRVEQGVQVTAWCPTPEARDAVVSALDLAFLEDARVLPLPDGTTAVLRYAGTAYDDGARKQPLFRRDLLLAVEYQAVLTRDLPPVAATSLTVASDPAGAERTVIQ